METTSKERAVIEDVIRKRAANKKKWAYRLCSLVAARKTLDTTYSDIVEWLNKEGLEMSENTLRKLMFDHNKKIEKAILTQNNPEQNKLDPEKKSFKPVQELTNKSEEVDLNEVLRNRVKEANLKNSGFDAFKDL